MTTNRIIVIGLQQPINKMMQFVKGIIPCITFIAVSGLRCRVGYLIVRKRRIGSGTAEGNDIKFSIKCTGHRLDRLNF